MLCRRTGGRVISAIVGVVFAWQLTAAPPKAFALRGLGGFASQPATEGPIRPHDKWALLICADSFQDPALRSYKVSPNNVVMLKSALIDPASGRFEADHVKVLAGRQATAYAVADVFAGWLDREALADDLVFIYVCGPASTAASGTPIVYCYDTLASEPERCSADISSLLKNLRRRTRSRLIVCAMDCGPAPGTNGFDLDALSESGASVLSATSGKQPSLTNGVTGSSVFVHHLVEALKHQGGGYTLAQVYDHVLQTVQADATNAFHSRQTPCLVAEDDSPPSQLVIGTPTKNAMPKMGLSFGHPLDRLAIDHPDIIPPRPLGSAAVTLCSSGQTQTAPPKPAKAATAGALPASGASLHAGAAQAPRSPKSGTGAHAKPATAGHVKIKGTSVDDEDEPAKPVDFQSYMKQMKQDIQSRWTPPKDLEDRRIVVTFTIQKDGRIVDARVIEGSGVAEIDTSALDALKKASPLQALPQGSPDSIDIKYKFDWQVHANHVVPGAASP